MRTYVHTFIAMMCATMAFGQTVLWERVYDLPENFTYAQPITDIATLDNGDLLLVGTAFYGNALGFEFIRFLRVTMEGDVVWDRLLKNEQAPLPRQEAHSVAALPDGHFMIAGNTHHFDPLGAVYLLKVSSLGDTIWSRSFQVRGETQSERMIHDETATYFITGTTQDTNVWLSFLAAVNDAGDTLWTKTFLPSEQGSSGYDLVRSADGGFVVCGTVAHDVVLSKLDAQGDLLWSQTYPFSDGGLGISVAETDAGDYLVGGGFMREGQYRPYLIRTNAAGEERERIELDAMNGFTSDIHVLPENRFVATTSDLPYFGTNEADGALYIFSADSTIPNKTALSGDGRAIHRSQDALYIGGMYPHNVDLNGSAMYLSKFADVISSANEAPKDAFGVVYPNPATDHLRLRLAELPTETITLLLYDLHGRQVWRTVINEMHTSLDLQSMSSGPYLFRLCSGDRCQDGRVMIIRN